MKSGSRPQAQAAMVAAVVVVVAQCGATEHLLNGLTPRLLGRLDYLGLAFGWSRTLQRAVLAIRAIALLRLLAGSGMKLSVIKCT